MNSRPYRTKEQLGGIARANGMKASKVGRYNKQDTSILMLRCYGFYSRVYETANGNCPVREFLDELKASDPDDFASVLAGLAKLRNRQYYREPLSKSLGDGLFELRHVGKLNTRVLWFFMKGKRIVAVHGIRNKGQAIALHDRKTAEERMHDWQQRTTHEKN